MWGKDVKYREQRQPMEMVTLIMKSKTTLISHETHDLVIFSCSYVFLFFYRFNTATRPIYKPPFSYLLRSKHASDLTLHFSTGINNLLYNTSICLQIINNLFIQQHYITHHISSISFFSSFSNT